jgi:demethylmenaquinone methyltransferase/2-methoxy-6-polyprenyl-1,4-benzoquinol methylase
MDRRWKALLLREAAARAMPGEVALDLACGTGDISFALARTTPSLTIVGLDVSREMLRIAVLRRAEAHAPAVRFIIGDIVSLPIGAGSVGMVTMGYALRNTRDFRAGLREIHRVLRPGGWMLNLDFYRPQTPLWRRLFLGYLRYAGLLAGWLWHREPEAYGYITPSIERFISSEQFERELRTHGFEPRATYRFLRGGVCVHVARRVA